MDFTPNLFLILTTLLFDYIKFSHGQTPKTEADRESEVKSCKAIFTAMNKMHNELVNECGKKLGYQGKEKAEKAMCIEKCALSEIKMLNDEGFLDEKSFDQYITVWPENMRENAKETFSPCFDHGGRHIDTSDPYCMGYDNLVKCLSTSFQNLCKGS